MNPTDKQRQIVLDLVKRGSRRGRSYAWGTEDPEGRDEDLIPYREATQEQKEKTAEILGLPLSHFLIRRLSKGEANRVIRQHAKEQAQ